MSIRCMRAAIVLSVGAWIVLVVLISVARAADFSHCGPDGASPPAPPEVCALQVPEPGTLVLVGVGLVVLMVRRRK